MAEKQKSPTVHTMAASDADAVADSRTARVDIRPAVETMTDHAGPGPSRLLLKDDSDWLQWSDFTRTLLEEEDAWKIVAGKRTAPAGDETALREFNMKSATAARIIKEGLASHVYVQMLDLRSPKEIWEKLERVYNDRAALNERLNLRLILEYSWYARNSKKSATEIARQVKMFAYMLKRTFSDKERFFESFTQVVLEMSLPPSLSKGRAQEKTKLSGELDGQQQSEQVPEMLRLQNALKSLPSRLIPPDVVSEALVAVQYPVQTSSQIITSEQPIRIVSATTSASLSTDSNSGGVSTNVALSPSVQAPSLLLASKPKFPAHANSVTVSNTTSTATPHPPSEPSSTSVQTCAYCHLPGHSRKNCPHRPDDNECAYCHEHGHSLRVCPTRPSPDTCAYCHAPGHHIEQCQERPVRNYCHNCSSLGHLPDACPNPPKICFHCHEVGHRQSLCPYLKKGQVSGRSEGGDVVGESSQGKKQEKGKKKARRGTRGGQKHKKKGSQVEYREKNVSEKAVPDSAKAVIDGVMEDLRGQSSSLVDIW